MDVEFLSSNLQLMGIMYVSQDGTNEIISLFVIVIEIS
jgi:hypothetical protein